MQGTEVRSGNPVLLLSGEIDRASAEGVSSSLRPLIEAGGPVIIDLSRVTFMDSTGLHVLLEAAKVLGERGCIIVHGAQGAVAKVIEITRLAQTRGNLHIIECSVLVRAA
jgi:anti-sigma B factor antagonist